jgi:twitching motility two-component system response regulator PilG
MTSRILLADDSPHAQRMGERILREEGYEVVTATDGDAALAAMDEQDPDVVLADVFLPKMSGYELCRWIKTSERHKHTGVILIAGLLEPVDEEVARNAGCDAVLKKPFEASAVLDAIRPLVDKAHFANGLFSDSLPEPLTAAPSGRVPLTVPQRPPLDPETIRAAVTLALDRSLPALVEEITEKMLLALGY